MFTDGRFARVTGFFILLFSAFLLLAFTSFLLTWKLDSNVLDNQRCEFYHR